MATMPTMRNALSTHWPNGSGWSLRHRLAGYEDVLYYMWKERRLPDNVNLRDNKLESEEERKRLTRIFEQGVTAVVGYALPLQYQWWLAEPRWASGLWRTRADSMFLLPGDSAMGFRLPLQSLTWVPSADYPTGLFPLEPFAERTALPDAESLRERLATDQPAHAARIVSQYAYAGGGAGGRGGSLGGDGVADEALAGDYGGDTAPGSGGIDPVIRTALCVEPREGRLHIFLPPLDRLEAYLELLTAIEATAGELGTPVVMEGYLPPHDDRLQHISLTPDPGVIEVNVHPAARWDQLVANHPRGLRRRPPVAFGDGKVRSGRHTHRDGRRQPRRAGRASSQRQPVPASPRSAAQPARLLAQSSVAVLFVFAAGLSGPPVRRRAWMRDVATRSYELEIAFQQTPTEGTPPPWLVDRMYRHLLVDGTGNTHRSEFCIDKLFSPDTAAGRLGLVEFRAFEMPPHSRMSLTQQLLLRALIARFWDAALRRPPWSTGTRRCTIASCCRIFVWQDFEDVIADLQQQGYALETAWFDPHFEFRFPKIGEFTQRTVQVELRQGIEPWYVLGEEPAAGSVARYVDSSVERLQVRVRAHDRSTLCADLQRSSGAACIRPGRRANTSPVSATAPGSHPAACIRPFRSMRPGVRFARHVDGTIRGRLPLPCGTSGRPRTRTVFR